MTTSTAPDAVALSEEDIAGWLRSHPDFFQRNSDLLATLRVPHATGGAVSLIERQIEVLREKNQNADSRFNELVSIARANEQLADTIHRFTRRLMRAPTRRAILTEIEQGMREDFGVAPTVLLLFGAAAGTDNIGLRFVRQVAADEPNLTGFDSLFASGKPRCGQIRDSLREFLFGSDDAASVSSVALVPLTDGEHTFGLLALGSPDSQRFHPGMSTDFLARLGEIIGDALARD
jgi:uncharacterized protein YigA (DUF484 family)